MDIKGALNRIVNQLDLTTEEMQAVMRQIMTGQCTDAQIGAFLMGMRMKSETIDEIVGAVAVMRELADGVQLPTLKHVVDVVGTGGDGANIFNVSSAASFVVAAAGGKVAMGTARIENNRDFAAAIAPAVGFDSGLLWRNPLGNLTLEAKGDYFHNGEVRRSLGFVQQVELGRDLGLRLSAEREFSHVGKPINEVKLELRWYYY